MDGTSLPNGGVARYAFAQNGEDFYVISGIQYFGSEGTLTTAVSRYNATTNIWTSLADIPFASEPAGAYYNGKIYVSDGTANSVMRIYDIGTNTWSAGPVRPLPSSSDSYGAAVGAFNGNVYVVGGSSGLSPIATLSIYNIATNSWSTGPASPTPFVAGGYRQIGQYLYLIGGYTNSFSNSNASMRLDMTTNTWTSGPSFTPQRADFGLAASGSRLFALGGNSIGGGGSADSAQVDMLETSAWPSGNWTASVPNLPYPRQGNRAGFFSTGRVGGEIWSTGGVHALPDNNLYVLPDHIFRSTQPVGCLNFNATTSMGNTLVPGTTDTGNHCDDCTTAITFPFPVALYGIEYSAAVVSSNGNIQFTGNNSALGTSCPLPDPRFGTAILAFQDDLLTSQTGNGISPRPAAQRRTVSSILSGARITSASAGRGQPTSKCAFSKQRGSSPSSMARRTITARGLRAACRKDLRDVPLHSPAAKRICSPG